MLDFRAECGEYGMLYRQEGRDMEYWFSSSTGGLVRAVNTDPGVRIRLGCPRTTASLSHGRAHFAGEVVNVVQTGPNVAVLVSVEAVPLRNVFCYDPDGKEIWRVGAPPPERREGAYTGVLYAGPGLFRAVNYMNFKVLIDAATGRFVEVKAGGR
jgi:hypothetical protein